MTRIVHRIFMAYTTEQKRSAFNAIVAVTEAIRQAGSHGIPSGYLYAALMSKGCDFAAFQKIESIVLGSGLVRKSGQLLTWIGPEILSEVA